jgi:glutaryl-CoA dehydrogenase
MKTRAEKTDGGYVLTGSKMWISNAPSPMSSWSGRSRKPWRQDPRLRAGKGHEGAVRAEDRRQALLARLVTGEIVMDGVEVGETRCCPMSRA